MLAYVNHRSMLFKQPGQIGPLRSGETFMTEIDYELLCHPLWHP